MQTPQSGKLGAYKIWSCNRTWTVYRIERLHDKVYSASYCPKPYLPFIYRVFSCTLNLKSGRSYSTKALIKVSKFKPGKPCALDSATLPDRNTFVISLFVSLGNILSISRHPRSPISIPTTLIHAVVPPSRTPYKLSRHTTISARYRQNHTTKSLSTSITSTNKEHSPPTHQSQPSLF